MGDGMDSNSGKTSQTRILGDGRIEVTEFVDGVLVSRTTTDAADAHDWTTIERHYDATGVRTGETRTYDDGRVMVVTVTDGRWASATLTRADGSVEGITWHRDADGTVTGETRTYGDGRVAETVYEGGLRTSVTVTDVADVFDWASYVERFDADGTLISRDYTPDPVDETPPVFVSGTAVSLAENSGAGQTVYVARATDDKGVTGYSLSGPDKDAFTIDAETGAVTLIGNPDFEQKSAYEFTVQAEDAAGNTASRTVSRRRVDILVADLNLPDGIGTTAIRELRRTQPEAQAIVMSVLNDAPMVIDAIRCGATGYVIKDDTAYNVKSAIETALDGQSPMSATIARLIVEAMRLPDSAFAPRDAADQDSPALTDRETEVLNAISRGYSFREVGELLGISPQTVPVHARNIYRKLEASNKSEAVFLARKHGLIPP